MFDAEADSGIMVAMHFADGNRVDLLFLGTTSQKNDGGENRQREN
jgi:hypothetical protein